MCAGGSIEALPLESLKDEKSVLTFPDGRSIPAATIAHVTSKERKVRHASLTSHFIISKPSFTMSSDRTNEILIWIDSFSLKHFKFVDSDGVIIMRQLSKGFP